jgi:hypothetical protein
MYNNESKKKGTSRMAEQVVHAKDPKSGNEAEVLYNFGDTLADAVSKFGEAAVFSAFKADAIVGLQARLRSAIRTGKDAQAVADSWKPGVRTVSAGGGESLVEKAKKRFAAMTPEQQNEFIAQLQAAVPRS